MTFFDELERQLVDAARRRRPVWRRGRVWEPLAIIAATAVVVAVVTIAVVAGAGRGRPATGAGAADAHVDPALVSSLRALSRPRRPDDALPPAFLAAASLRGSGARSIQSLSLADARREPIPHTPFEVWVVPGRDTLCLFAAERQAGGGLVPRTGFGAACDPAAVITGGFGVVSWAQSRSAVAFGAVCNEVARVELHSGNGAVRQVPLVEGLFAVRARPGDQLYAVTASGGHVPVGAPAPAAPVPTAVFAGPRPVAQLNLLPPSGAGGAKSPAGKAQVVMIGSGRRGIVISARSMPANTRGDAYAVWLFSDKLHLVMLGFVNPGVGRNGRLSTAGGLPGDAASYRYILITLETSHSPRVPGRVVLEGSFAVR